MTFGLPDAMQLHVMTECFGHVMPHCLYWALTGTVRVEAVTGKGVGQTVKADSHQKHVASCPEQAKSAVAVVRPVAVVARPET